MEEILYETTVIFLFSRLHQNRYLVGTVLHRDTYTTKSDKNIKME